MRLNIKPLGMHSVKHKIFSGAPRAGKMVEFEGAPQVGEYGLAPNIKDSQ